MAPHPPLSPPICSQIIAILRDVSMQIKEEWRLHKEVLNLQNLACLGFLVDTLFCVK